MQFDQSIFKAYDIRGIYPSQLNADVAYAIGRAFAGFLPEKKEGNRVAVGGDMRLSTPELKDALIRGLVESGVHVDDVGTVSTPTLYFATGFFGYDGGVQVSASHNPQDWNGCKFVGPKGRPISKETGLVQMRDAIANDELMPLASEASRGSVQKRDNILEAEIKEHTTNLPTAHKKALKIAIDAGNGMGAADMQPLFEKLPHTVIWMNETPDGTFPAHPADPLVSENNAALREKIVAEKCDMGIAIDGDGDRYFFFDERGHTVPQEIVRGIMAQIELEASPGGTVVYDVRPGKVTTDLIDEAGGRAVMAPVGHSLIKEVMLAEEAIFGGESSGHFFYSFPYGTFEAPMALVLKFLAYVTDLDKPLSAIVDPHKKYFNSGEINTKLATHGAGLEILKKLQHAYADGRHYFLDGLSVEYPDYWFSVRLSNTEPLIRFIIEARSEELMETKRDEILDLIRAT
jgi:phosphomannomutase